MQPLPAPALGRDFQVLSEPDVMSIKAPAMGRHPEDVPALAEFFVRQYSEIFQKGITGLIQSAIIRANAERLLRDFKVKSTKAKEDRKGTLAARSLNISPACLHRLIRLPEEPEAADVA